MAYTPIGWVTGDTITADKLNKMDNGWSVESTQLFSESITTAGSSPAPVATLVYDTEITAESLTVTFGGTDYTVSKTVNPMGNMYGEAGSSGPSFTNYPFCIISASGTNVIYTETAGTYSVSASGPVLEISTDFTNAVKTASASYAPFVGQLYVTTWQEVWDAMTEGRFCVLIDTDSSSYINYEIIDSIGAEPYQISTRNGGSTLTYTASSADDVITD